MQLLRLNDGVTQQQFQDTLQGALKAVQTEGEAAIFRIFSVSTLAGGPSSIGPGQKSEAVANLQPGQYALVCFIPSADGVPHLTKGMVKTISITAAPAQQPAEPASVATVSMEDFKFVGLPASLSSKTAT